MSNRCSDCNKFVSLEAEEPEVLDVQINDDNVSASVRLSLSCSECGAEMKEAYFEFEEPFPGLEEHANEKHDSVMDFEVREDGMSTDDYFKNTDRNGKPIKSHRYMKHMYNIDLDIKADCNLCGEEFAYSLKDELQASGFDELF